MPGYLKSRRVYGLSLRGIVVADAHNHRMLQADCPKIYDVIAGNAVGRKRKLQHKLHKMGMHIELHYVERYVGSVAGTVPVPVYVIHDKPLDLGKAERAYRTRSSRAELRRHASRLIRDAFASDPDVVFMSAEP